MTFEEQLKKYREELGNIEYYFKYRDTMIELERLKEKHQYLVRAHDMLQATLKIDNSFNPDITLHELEKRYVRKALVTCEGNKTRAAECLGITIKTLYNKLHEYGDI